LPGTAYARRQHLWLTGANEVESRTFSRAILAKVLTNYHFIHHFSAQFPATANMYSEEKKEKAICPFFLNKLFIFHYFKLCIKAFFF